MIVFTMVTCPILSCGISAIVQCMNQKLVYFQLIDDWSNQRPNLVSIFHVFSSMLYKYKFLLLLFHPTTNKLWS